MRDGRGSATQDHDNVNEDQSCGLGWGGGEVVRLYFFKVVICLKPNEEKVERSRADPPTHTRIAPR